MMQRIFFAMLIFVPLTFAAEHFHFSPIAVMALACLGIIPVAKFMGEATEHMSHKVGPTVGGLVSATFGNACELIIAFFALRAGMIDVVKASITGSIIGNLLLILGASMLVGGLKFKEQKFNAMTARTAATVMTIMSMALMMPAAAHHMSGQTSMLGDESMALGIGGVLLVLYCAGLFFNLKTHRHLFTPVADSAEDPHDMTTSWSMTKSLVVLIAATLTVVFLSEALVDNVGEAAKTMGMTPVFMGVILLAIIGNAAENSTAIIMAHKGKMDLSINIAFGSSMQIAMFVAPVLVIAGYFMGQPMNFVFSEAEILAVFASAIVMKGIVEDGKSNWLEGLYLLGLYTIVGITFYFLR